MKPLHDSLYICRCPPVQNKVNEDCVTLPDPQDECCTVNVCNGATNNGAIDVQRVQINGNNTHGFCRAKGFFN